MNIQWNRPRGNINKNQLQEFEEKLNIEFPKEYKNIVLKYNGAKPSKKIFSFEGRKECVFEKLINWDKDSKANIYFWHKTIGIQHIIPFGEDPFGNCICFNFKHSKEPEIIFWDHETNITSYVAHDFNMFLLILRED